MKIWIEKSKNMIEAYLTHTLKVSLGCPGETWRRLSFKEAESLARMIECNRKKSSI